jgi:hypothetical protein
VRTIAELSGKVIQKGATYEPEMQVLYQHNGTKMEGPMNPSTHAEAFHEAGIATKSP